MCQTRVNIMFKHNGPSEIMNETLANNMQCDTINPDGMPR